MDNEFPKITFDIFEFARKHGCMIRMWFEDYSFNNCFGEPISNYILRIDVVKKGLQHCLAFTYAPIREYPELDINENIEKALKDAISQLSHKDNAIRGRKWQ